MRFNTSGVTILLCIISAFFLFRRIILSAENPSMSETLLGEHDFVKNRPSFSTWLDDLKTEAQKAWKIRSDVLESALADVEFLPCVLKRDRQQPESIMTFQAYLAKTVTATRVASGRERMNAHRELLNRISTLYGVPQRFIVALWGIETHFGLMKGNFLVVNALATLAYDSRRSTYFRQELLTALAILDRGHITPEQMRGSWAGAMGQNQFMPSSFLRFAKDHDGDGSRDIWSTEADIFASIANYLAKSGWKDGQSWGQAVRLPEGFDLNLAMKMKTVKKSLKEWTALGVRTADGRSLPERSWFARLILPDGNSEDAVLLFDNYDVILKWNRANLFALAVGYLADQLQ